MLKDIVSGSTGSNPTNLTSGAGLLANTLLFTVDSNGAGGQEPRLVVLLHEQKLALVLDDDHHVEESVCGSREHRLT